MPYSDPIKQKEAQRRWYLRNKKKIYQRSRKAIDRKREYAKKAKEKPCVDCKIKYPWYVMDFDHKKGEEKDSAISQLVWKRGLKKLKQEIKKCDVVCSNCHRIRTYKRGYTNQY